MANLILFLGYAMVIEMIGLRVPNCQLIVLYNLIIMVFNVCSSFRTILVSNVMWMEINYKKSINWFESTCFLQLLLWLFTCSYTGFLWTTWMKSMLRLRSVVLCWDVPLKTRMFQVVVQCFPILALETHFFTWQFRKHCCSRIPVSELYWGAYDHFVLHDFWLVLCSLDFLSERCF